MCRLVPFLFLLAGLLANPPLCAGIALRHADGSALLLDGAVSRLVTLSPNLTELVYAAGAGSTLLATVEYSEYPTPAARLPRVGDAFRLDIEGIVARRPELVIAWDSGNPRAAVEQLRSLGVTVWSVEIRRPGEIADVLLDIGRATNHSAAAGRAAADFRARLERLTAQHNGARPVDYFYQVDAQPLFTLNGEHLVSQGLALCGGRNIFAEQPALAFQVAREAVVAADPDVLIAPVLPGQADPLAQWREWPAMRAVVNGALITLDADRISRATPRWLDSIETACARLERLRQP